MKSHKHLGSYLYKLRTLNQLTQKEFGSIFRMSVQQVSNAERGVSSFPKKARLKLGRVRGFDKNKLQTALIKDETDNVLNKLNG